MGTDHEPERSNKSTQTPAAAPADISNKGGQDHDMQKGAKEDGRRGVQRSDHPGLDNNGLPNDPVAIASDALGANEDKSQG